MLFVVNNYLGNEVIEGTVQSVNKTSSDVKSSSVEVTGSSVAIAQEKSNEILKPYEVSVRVSDKKKIRIFNNDNNIWRWKFNKREIQLQLQEGETYWISVDRFLFGTNILSIEEID